MTFFTCVYVQCTKCLRLSFILQTTHGVWCAKKKMMKLLLQILFLNFNVYYTVACSIEEQKLCLFEYLICMCNEKERNSEQKWFNSKILWLCLYLWAISFHRILPCILPCSCESKFFCVLDCWKRQKCH